MRIPKNFQPQSAPIEYGLLALGVAIGTMAIMKAFGFG